MNGVLIRPANDHSVLFFEPEEGITFGSNEDIGELRQLVNIRTPVRSHVRDTKTKVLRRLQGFLVEHGKLECKVGLVEKGEVHFYYLPADNLRRGKIETENQPFEMDEVEMSFNDGRSVKYYEFRPLAKAADAFPDPINLSEELKQKRAFVLRELAKLKD